MITEEKRNTETRDKHKDDNRLERWKAYADTMGENRWWRIAGNYITRQRGRITKWRYGEILRSVEA
jgi:hypothetical protein